MNRTHSSVKFHKVSNRYYTYQFYAEMANKNIDPKDGLKIAALTCFSWLRSRFDEGCFPGEIDMPSPNDYKKVNDNLFKSFSINDICTISVESNIEDGIWALNTIENGTNTDTGEVVPGRTIQSDIGFRIIDNKLTCAFKTTINDLKSVEKADCYRFAVIKELSSNPNFGFIQVKNIYDPNNMIIDDESKLDEVYSLLHSRDNQLPFIIYTYDDHTLVDVDDINIDDFRGNLSSLGNKSKEILNRVAQDNKEPSDDITARNAAYATRNLGYARTYFLSKKMFSLFKKKFNVKEVGVDYVFIIDAFNYQVKRYAYEDKDKYKKYIVNYTRDKKLDFHDVLFVEEARIIARVNNEEAIKEREKLLDEANEKIEQISSKQARETRKSEHVASNSNKELIDTYEKLRRSEEENQTLSNEITRLKKENQNKNEYIDYLLRKESRPRYHKDIANWAEQFNYVVLDKKAKDCLDKKDAENVDINVICDALDYLDKAYSKYLFENITTDELNDISDRIYHRPYNVSPSGIPSSARSDCKIKYEFKDERRKEHVLDQHLKIGAHGELLRIYFIIDKDQKKIVIGSLPNHLEY